MTEKEKIDLIWEKVDQMNAKFNYRRESFDLEFSHEGIIFMVNVHIDRACWEERGDYYTPSCWCGRDDYRLVVEEWRDEELIQTYELTDFEEY